MTTEAALDWFDDLWSRWLPGDNHLGLDPSFLRAYYGVRYDVAKRLQPKVIVEIGVRSGQSAFAFLSACPGAEYVGIDCYDFPGYSDRVTHLPHTTRLLSRWPSARIVLADSQRLSALPVSNPDLVHVDGEHSENGCYHDCTIAWNSGARWILVDDVTAMDYVAKGAQRFCEEHGLAFELVDVGQQGAWLIDCKR